MKIACGGGTGATAQLTIWTIGHGARELADFLTTLGGAEIDLLIDVRRYPASRRHPHFSGQQLAESLANHGVEYRWSGEELGGRRRDSGRPSRWRNPAFAAYAEHMETEAFADGLTEVERAARDGRRVAVMCSERLWWRCHRRLIADALSDHCFEVRHLIIAGRPGDAHRSTTS